MSVTGSARAGRAGDRVAAFVGVERRPAPTWVTAWRVLVGLAIRAAAAARSCASAVPDSMLKVEVDPPRPMFAITVRQSARQIEVTAMNDGTSQARDVRFGPAEIMDTREVPVLEPGRRTTATIAVTAAGAPASIELHWIDRLGVPGRQLIDL